MTFEKQEILVDTGFFLALNNPLDPDHQNAKSALKTFPRVQWITTWPVITEVCHLLWRYRPTSIQSFLKSYENGGFDVFSLEKEHIARVCNLMSAYQDLPMDLADASLVLLAEAVGHGKILTTDRRDFSTYRWGNKKKFENLLPSNSPR